MAALTHVPRLALRLQLHRSTAGSCAPQNGVPFFCPSPRATSRIYDGDDIASRSIERHGAWERHETGEVLRKLAQFAQVGRRLRWQAAGGQGTGWAGWNVGCRMLHTQSHYT